MPPPNGVPPIGEGLLEELAQQAILAIQEQEDREILRVLNSQVALETGPILRRPQSLATPPLTPGLLREVYDQITSQSLRPERMLMNSRDLEDIRRWAAEHSLSGHQGHFIEASYVESPALPPGSVYAVTEPEFVGRFPVSAQRVQIPEFELFSNPTIRIAEVRQRRFDLIERGRDPAVTIFLEALLRAKTPAPIPERVPGPPKTVWEALLELDLVDAGTP